ncbi:hypothetical protein LINPERHAP2_LOCUS18899 [Linum perenne]
MAAPTTGHVFGPLLFLWFHRWTKIHEATKPARMKNIDTMPFSSSIGGLVEAESAKNSNGRYLELQQALI